MSWPGEHIKNRLLLSAVLFKQGDEDGGINGDYRIDLRAHEMKSGDCVDLMGYAQMNRHRLAYRSLPVSLLRV